MLRPLYEALAAFAIAGLLTVLSRRIAAPAVFGTYLVLTGATRLLVEFVRINDPALFGLTQPQLWSLLAVAIGAGILLSHSRRISRAPGRVSTTTPDPGAEPQSHTGQPGSGVVLPRTANR